MNIFYRGWELKGDKGKTFFTATKGNGRNNTTLVDTSIEQLKKTIDRLSHKELLEDD